MLTKYLASFDTDVPFVLISWRDKKHFFSARNGNVFQGTKEKLKYRLRRHDSTRHSRALVSKWFEKRLETDFYIPLCFMFNIIAFTLQKISETVHLISFVAFVFISRYFW